MSLSETPTAPRSSGSAARSVRLHGWGGGPGVRADVVAPREERELAELLADTARPVICRGMGRSYGDAAQREGGLVLDLRSWRWWTLDDARGTVRAGAGATLGQLLGQLAPAGWLLPVVPGTQHVSVGGAIASDIHGKNHGTAGTFGAHVRALGLLTADGDSLELSREDGGELFEATIGGMGLTGVITWAEIELQRVPPGAELSVDIDRVEDLDATFAALDSAEGGPHRVAWLDLLGRPLARGVVTRAEIAAPEARTPHGRRPGRTPTGSTATVAAKARVPAWWPGGALRPETVRAFNAQRFHLSPRRARGNRETFGAHMFPLDALDAWPRLYGRAGFLQYQCVLPRGREAELQTVLERVRASSTPCYLAVLKDFGPENSALLSFPLAGWTLALDLPRTSDLLPLLTELDGIVAGAGGRVYLAKDARLAPDTLAAMYPRLPRWHAVRDQVDPEGRWQSDLARRTGLVAS
ncbi:MAG TPA: FAD-binding oxidoreductase [Solirubrobacteraceae bacterium]|nr:FAD-binding oxidoreductase [Solirubrobacteraceae bacterium]